MYFCMYNVRRRLIIVLGINANKAGRLLESFIIVICYVLMRKWEMETAAETEGCSESLAFSFRSYFTLITKCKKKIED